MYCVSYRIANEPMMMNDALNEITRIEDTLLVLYFHTRLNHECSNRLTKEFIFLLILIFFILID